MYVWIGSPKTIWDINMGLFSPYHYLGCTNLEKQYCHIDIKLYLSESEIHYYNKLTENKLFTKLISNKLAHSA